MSYESPLYVAGKVFEWFEDDRIVFVVNMSGGKDSTAAAVLMLELAAEYPEIRPRLRFVFADTGWEAPETYVYLDMLRDVLGITIDVVGYPGGMEAKIRDGTRFAARLQRWCTRELKVLPLREYYDRIAAQGMEAVCVTGIRAEESESRAKMAMVEDDDQWGGWMWRPLRNWTVEDVLDAHHRAGVPVNPLYRRGHDRVGCYPCIMSSKNDIRLVAEHAPDRIALIRALEAHVTAERGRRNVEKPGRYKWTDGTFFQNAYDKGPYKGAQGIDDVVKWAQTERGGRQLPMFREPPDGGCFRWGLCDAPPRADEAV